MPRKSSPRSVATHVGRVVRGLFAWVFLAAGVYVGAGFALGAMPANADWSPPDRGIRIYLESNDVHTGFILPKVAAGIDWRDLAEPGDIRDRRYAGYDHLSIGWGDRDFYQAATIGVGIALRAATGSPHTVLYVRHMPAPSIGPQVRAVTLRPEEYRRLAGYIRSSFAVAGDGSVPSRPGFGGYDAFYTANGRYSAIHDCNNWTSDALRGAGVRTGRWTPFAPTVMWWFR